MLNILDNFLNRITMYRLMLYGLFGLLVAAAILSLAHQVLFSVAALLFSSIVLTVACLITNEIFAKVFEVPANVESAYITAWILTLIITPSISLATLPLLIWAAVISQASKYILGFAGKHFFNPAAVAVAITALTLNQSASWWVGTAWMLPFVLIVGILVVRKIQRFHLVWSFLVAALVMIFVTSISRSDPTLLLKKIFLDTPIIFFATVMLSEPLTTPPTLWPRIAYGALVGLLYAPQVHIVSIYSTPELALLVGNVASYLISPKSKAMMVLKQKNQLSDTTMEFVFETNRKLNFRPGQYLEWTLGHQKPDGRGNRRYFTIASSPTEDTVHLGVKFYDTPSSFKRSLFQMQPGDKILAGSLAGDFTLPHDQSKKLVFIAGGIGITPFRSMLKYLTDKNERRDIVLLYSASSEQEFVYPEILAQAESLGVKIVKVVGRLSSELIAAKVPDFTERHFYISGPHGMVVDFEKTLASMGIPRVQIKVDFFPGFA